MYSRHPQKYFDRGFHLSTRRTGAAGVSLVKSQVQARLKSDWQDIDAENDDGIDGAIFLRHREKFFGRILFVQVKSGPSYKIDYRRENTGFIGVQIGEDYIISHRPRWDALPGPVILIYVEDPDASSPKMYWQDLKKASSYSATNKAVVLVPRQQTFGSEAKGALRRLTGSVPDQLPLTRIDLSQTKSTLATPRFSQRVARSFYRHWSQSSDRTHPELGVIEVTNLGWRHMTRNGRRPENILNGFMLMEAAREMVVQGAGWRQLGSAKMRERARTIDIVDMLALRAEVIFRHRAPGPVQVILRRTRSIDKTDGVRVVREIRFLSVHELRRGASAHYGPY